MPRVVVLNRYPYTQNTPSTSWTIDHNLNVTHPVVDVWILGNDGKYMNSDAHEVIFTSANQVIISFAGADIAPRGNALIT